MNVSLTIKHEFLFFIRTTYFCFHYFSEHDEYIYIFVALI